MILLLILSFIASISIGIPNGLLGSSWPVMYQELNVSIGNAGVFSIIISVGTIVSGITNARLIKRWGTVAVLAMSQLVLALSLLAFTITGNFYILCIICFPIGYSAGAIDTALTAYLTLHYKAIFLNWLHAFWAVGAAAGPLFVSYSLLQWNTWKGGYLITVAFQVFVFLALIFTVPRWNSVDKLPIEGSTEGHVLVPLNKVWQIKEPEKPYLCYSVFVVLRRWWGFGKHLSCQGSQPSRRNSC